MNLIAFNDHCVITRAKKDANGRVIYDSFDEPQFDEIYNNSCSYQAGGQTSLSVIARNDQVYLPSNDVLIMSGDVIDVVTARGRNRYGIVDNVRDIEMPITHELLTKIEIKQSIGE